MGDSGVRETCVAAFTPMTEVSVLLYSLLCECVCSRSIMPCIKSLKVTYNPVNERNTFTNDDLISGQVRVETGKDLEISSLFIKFSAKAEVRWTERYGQTTVVYHAKQKYFNSKHYFILHNKGTFTFRVGASSRFMSLER